jgi:hypothetical protein
MDNEPMIAEETQEPEAMNAGLVSRRGRDLPLGLTLVALLIWFGFQTTQVIVERSNLGALQANLDGAMQESQKLQSQLHSLITKTAELADQGNAAAKAVVEELEKKGIPIKAAAQSAK